MDRIFMLALGLGARALSVVSGFLSDWILTRLADGAFIGVELASEAYEFGEWLLVAVAQYLAGGRVEYTN